MVARLLPGVKIAGPDAADALAVAISHAHHLASARGASPRRGRRMIAQLEGPCSTETGADHAVIDVGGVGYLVGASARTLAALGPVGEARDAVHRDAGRARISSAWSASRPPSERDWFRLLTGVQGVGARVALAILSALDARRTAPRGRRAATRRWSARANGVGPEARRAHRPRTEGQGRRRRARQRRAPRRADRQRGGGRGLARCSTSASAPPKPSRRGGAAEDGAGRWRTLDALVRLALRKAAK